MSVPSIPKPAWKKATDTPTYPNPMVPTMTTTGEGTMGDLSVLSTHNNDRGSRMPSRAPTKENFHRGAMALGESLGARLSVTMSSKLPSNSKEGGMSAKLKIVTSGKGRGLGGFSGGRKD